MTHMYGFNYDQKINKKVSITPGGVMNVNIDNPVTAFGDLTTAELTPQVHLTFPYEYIDPDIVTVGTSNGGSSFAGDSMLGISTGTATNGSAYFESRDIVKHFTGLGSMVRFTCIYNDGTGVANSEQLAGIGDEENGYFFGYNGTSFGTVQIYNNSADWTYQSDWNLDTFDGTNNGNPSGINLDTSRINLFQIEYQWSGGGQIQYSIENPDTGLLTPVNKVKFSNVKAPVLANPSLPLTGRVKNLGNNTNIFIKIVSMGGFVQGKSIISGPIKSYFRQTTLMSSNTETVMFSLKNSELINNGLINRIRVYFKIFSSANDSNKTAIFSIYRNLTFSFANFTDINNSVMQKSDTDTPTSFDDNKLILKKFIPKENGSSLNLESINLFLVPGDILTVSCKAESTTDNFTTNLTWIEDF